MKKRILYLLLALVLVLALSVPALAAETFYPVSVDEYTAGELDEPRINKVYRLSLSDDPSGIPTDDFVRDGRQYYLLDLIRKDEVGVDTQPCTRTVTLPSTTNSMESVLQSLEAEMEVETDEGYTGTLKLDHTSVHVTVDGYKSSTKNHSATRTFPNLSEADLSLLPKTVTEGGRTLSLATVQWSSSYDDDGEGGAAIRYSATASYTGSSTHRYDTGYTITADYNGVVAQVYAEETTFEYFDGTGWRRLVCETPTGGLFNTDQPFQVSLTFTCPQNWQPSDGRREEVRCIRMQLIKSDNCYYQPANHHYPVISDLTVSYSYEERYEQPRRLYSFCGSDRQDVTAHLAGGEAVPVLRAQPYQDDALYLCFDQKMEDGPVSLMFRMQEETVERRERLSVWYSSRNGWERMRFLDYTEHLCHTGTILFMPSLARSSAP